MLRAGKYPYLLKQRIIGNYGHLSNITSAETVEYLIKKGTKNGSFTCLYMDMYIIDYLSPLLIGKVQLI